MTQPDEHDLIADFIHRHGGTDPEAVRTAHKAFLAELSQLFSEWPGFTTKSSDESLPNLRVAYNARGLTQSGLAAKAGIAQQQVARFEDPSTNPTLATIEALVKALDGNLSMTIVPAEVAKAKRRAAAR